MLATSNYYYYYLLYFEKSHFGHDKAGTQPAFLKPEINTNTVFMVCFC